jgi:hypothetical protein
MYREPVFHFLFEMDQTQHYPLKVLCSVGDLDPQDPHVFGPPGSGTGSTSQRCGSGSFPFLIYVPIERAEIMPAKQNFKF